MASLFDVFMGETLGTMVLVALGNGIVANCVFGKTKGTKGGWVAITLGWAMAVFCGVIVADIFHTGGHLNPAVTIANAAAGNLSADYTMVYLISEIIGALLGQLIVNIIYWQHLKDEDTAVVLGMHATGPTHQKAWGNNLFTEFIGTALLVTVAMFGLSTGAARGEGLTPIMGALSVGLTILAIGLSLGGTTGYAINPARDLIPRLIYFVMYKSVLKSKKGANANWMYSWVPVAAPLVAGAVVGGAFRFY